MQKLTNDQKSFADQIYIASSKIAKELEQGKDIIIKAGPGGLKIQSMKVSTLK